jgi:tryptophan halogenase
MAMQGRFARPAKGQDEHFSYAYHFDANLFAVFLRTIALKRGVRRTEGRIVDVTRRADGGIDQLKLADGRAVAGDLYID